MELRKQPGRALTRALKKMSEFLVTQQAAGVDEGDLRPVVRSYLTAVLLPSCGTSMSLRNREELRLLAETIDMLISGDIMGAADLLALRFQAVEMSHHDSGWMFAKHLIPLPDAAVTSTGRSARARLLKDEEREIKLRALAQGPSAPRRGPPPG